MKITLAILMSMLTINHAALAQFTLTAGQTYSYSFTTLSGPYYTPMLLSPDGQVYLTLGSALRVGDEFTYSMFEDSNATVPIFSRIVNGPNLSPYPWYDGHAFNAWRDLEGAVRISVTSGSVTVDRIYLFRYSGSEYYSASIVPVPEPSSTALGVAMVLGYLICNTHSRARKNAA
jgi:hypothetical protein